MRLDWEGVKIIAYEIAKAFASKAEAAGSMALSGTSLNLRSVDGSTELSSVNLDDGFATDTEAAAANGLTSDNFTLKLKSCDGTVQSEVPLTSQAQTALDGRYGANLSITGRTIHMKSKSGNDIGDGVTVPETDISGKADRSDAISSVTVRSQGNTVIIEFWDVDGNFQDRVSFTVGS